MICFLFGLAINETFGMMKCFWNVSDYLHFRVCQTSQLHTTEMLSNALKEGEKLKMNSVISLTLEKLSDCWLWHPCLDISVISVYLCNILQDREFALYWTLRCNISIWMRFVIHYPGRHLHVWYIKHIDRPLQEDQTWLSFHFLFHD